MDAERGVHDTVSELDDDWEAVTDGILGGGHYDSEPSLADADPRSFVGAARPWGDDRAERRGNPSGQSR